MTHPGRGDREGLYVRPVHLRANPGNLGKRYRLQMLESISVNGNEVTAHLHCGHEHVYNETYRPEVMIPWWERQVGVWKMRCYDCAGARS